MAAFSTFKSFQNFRQQVLRESRYMHNDEARAFLETVLDTSKNRRRRCFPMFHRGAYMP